ncbi:hypothetical protein MSIMFI_05437 [Mycobacterium simulans]|nr:hypothetical protein MSIMFI_05437 [Mycobacterium simulans]
MTDRQRGGLVAVGSALLTKLVDVSKRPSNHDRGGAVDGSDRGVGVVSEQSGDVIRAGLDGQHGPGRASLHQPAPGTDQNRGVRKGKHVGQIGRGQFSDGMAHHNIRADPNLSEHGVHGHPERKQGWLSVSGLS